MPAAICPAIGSGRGITNYMTRCELEATLQNKFRIRNDAEYRSDLQAQPQKYDATVKTLTPFQMYWNTTCPKI